MWTFACDVEVAYFVMMREQRGPFVYKGERMGRERLGRMVDRELGLISLGSLRALCFARRTTITTVMMK